MTREEKAGIKRLVVSMCANYDRDCGCLPLDCECYMLDKCYTRALCRYFREAVLPLDPALEAALCSEGAAPEMRLCPVCGGAFLPRGGGPTAPRLAPGQQGGNASGTICGKTGAEL